MEKSLASLYMDMNVLMVLMIFLLKIDNNNFVINSLIWFRGHDMGIYLFVFYLNVQTHSEKGAIYM